MQILGSVIATVIGGVILAFLIQDGRFDPDPTPSPQPTEVAVVPTDTPPSTTTLDPPSPTPNPASPMPAAEITAIPSPNSAQTIRYESLSSEEIDALFLAWQESEQANDDWTPVTGIFDDVEMVLVPPGCFEIGSDAGEGDEKPTDTICIEEAFWLDRYEVSNAAYGSVGCENHSSEPEQPRNCIDWFSAREYCEANSGRLMTEAEWEFSARGPDALKYTWGNTWDGTQTNFCDVNCPLENVADEGWDDGYAVTAPVQSFEHAASWVGASNLIGNVVEWTASIYDEERFPYPYALHDGRNNLEETGVQRVSRGSSFRFRSSRHTGYQRHGNPDNETYSSVGFRCAMDYQPAG